MTKKTARTVLTDRQIRSIDERLTAGKPVRRTLPNGGRLHIDRTLPFLVIYRKPRERNDAGTDRLVKGEASYLILPGAKSVSPGITNLITTVIRNQVRDCGSFLLIEIWSADLTDPAVERDIADTSPIFRLCTNSLSPSKTVETMSLALKKVSIQRHKAVIESVTSSRIAPAGLSPLLSAKALKQLNCSIIGMAVDPIYQHSNAAAVYPLVLRNLHRGIDRALKKTFFQFTRNHTSLTARNYLALGRRAVVKAVWDVDRELARLSNSFDFLLQVTPVNSRTLWTKFKASRFQSMRAFSYRPLPFDPSIQKRRLYKIEMDRIEDPTLANLFHETRLEIDRKLTMLHDRDQKEFLYGSFQVFGGEDRALTLAAKEILQKLARRKPDETAKQSYTAEQFSVLAKAEIAHYRKLNPNIRSTVQVRPDIVGLMVSHGNLLVGESMRIPQKRADALIQHEVGTHVLTFVNGRSQPLNMLHCGLPRYEELQEGLAVLSEYMVDGLTMTRLKLLAGRVVAVGNLIDGATFIDNFRSLNKDYGFNQNTAFSVAVRVHRGGGLTKDAVYLRGLIELLRYLKDGGDMTPLYTGKLSVNHIPIVRELQLRKVLKPVQLKPRYLEYTGFDSKLTALKTGLTPIDLIRRKH